MQKAISVHPDGLEFLREFILTIHKTPLPSFANTPTGHKRCVPFFYARSALLRAGLRQSGGKSFLKFFGPTKSRALTLVSRGGTHRVQGGIWESPPDSQKGEGLSVWCRRLRGSQLFFSLLPRAYAPGLDCFALLGWSVDYLGVFIILNISIRRLPGALPRTISWLGLARSVNWRGLSERGMASGRDFSLKSVIFLLLCSLYICYIVRVLQPGAASAEGAASNKSLPAGETRNGLQPCGLWPIVWVPVTAAP